MCQAEMRSIKIFLLITDLTFLSKIQFKRVNSFDKQFFSDKIVATLSFIQLNLTRINKNQKMKKSS